MVIRLPAFSFCVQRNCLYNVGVPFIKKFGIILKIFVKTIDRGIAYATMWLLKLCEVGK